MSTSVDLSPQEQVASVGRALEAFLLRNRRTPSPHPYVWASGNRECERRMVLDLTAPDQQPPPDAQLLAKFRRGDDRERDILADLIAAGRNSDPVITITNQQERFEVRGRSGAVVIAGKVDARLRIGDGRAAPMEVKAWAPMLVQRIEKFEDVFENPWTRSGGFQLLSYLFGANEPYGFLVLDRSGLPLVLPVELTPNLERMEEFLARAERVVEHARTDTLPPFIDDAAECKRCPFYGTACQPPLSAKVAEVIFDPELEAHLERWHELRGPGKEWQALDMDLKRHLRGVDQAIVGHFTLTGRWQKQSRVELPEHLKKQFTITDPKGRFLLEIERL